MLNVGERCPLCADGRLERRAPEHEITIGGIRVTDKTTMVLVCGSCSETFVTAEQRQGYERRAVATILRERTQVPGSVVHVARKWLGLTQKDLAALMETSAETVSRWENDHLAIPRAEQLAIVALLDGVAHGQVDLASALEAARSSRPPQPTELQVTAKTEAA
jgi:putative zinc finger/helix-turn-helix YgiT family protein